MSDQPETTKERLGPACLDHPEAGVKVVPMPDAPNDGGHHFDVLCETCGGKIGKARV